MGRPISAPKTVASLRADYVVICTGYTSRLLKRDVQAAMEEESDGGVSVVCIKDDLWGKRAGISLWTDSSVDEASMRQAIDTLEHGIRDGCVVLRLNTERVRACPLIALRYFTRRFNSSSDSAYCSCFDGVPEQLLTFRHESLGDFVALVFDCESG